MFIAEFFEIKLLKLLKILVGSATIGKRLVSMYNFICLMVIRVIALKLQCLLQVVTVCISQYLVIVEINLILHSTDPSTKIFIG